MVSKVIELAAKDLKVLSYHAQIAFTFTENIEIGLNDQNNGTTCGIQANRSGC